VWFLTGSQGLYGEETLQQVAQQSQEIAKELGAALPVELAWKPVLTDSPGIHQTMLAANADPDCIGVIAWMHTFSPARMWIHGLDALQKPLLHLHTQANQALPWSTIDMDFMNLNQAAHGDREFGYIEARLGVVRKIVAGHVSDAVVQGKVAAWTRAARGWAEVRSLRLARFGDTMRDVAVTEGDRTEAQWRWGVTATRSPTSPTPCTRASTPRSTASSPSTRSATRSSRSCGGAASGTSRSATAHGSNWACARCSTRRVRRRSPPTSRTSARCASSPASPCSG
jgi:hypothetical protein